eukprot:6172349-Pleurochrysis_carterae.AAC.3
MAPRLQSLPRRRSRQGGAGVVARGAGRLDARNRRDGPSLELRDLAQMTILPVDTSNARKHGSARSLP